MNSDEMPEVPLDLLEWLESYILSDPPSGLDTDADAWAYIGRVCLVRRLRMEYNLQNESKVENNL